MSAAGYCLSLLQGCGDFVIERAAAPEYRSVQSTSVCSFAVTGNTTDFTACVRRQGLDAMGSSDTALTYFTLGALACIGSAFLIYGFYRDIGDTLWRAWQRPLQRHNDASDNV